MMKIAIIILSVYGASIALSHFFPSIAAVAFVVGGFGISYLLLACSAVGVLVHRNTK